MKIENTSLLYARLHERDLRALLMEVALQVAAAEEALKEAEQSDIEPNAALLARLDQRLCEARRAERICRRAFERNGYRVVERTESDDRCT